MNDRQNQITERTKAHISDALMGEGTGHDWWHIQRVWDLALTIAKEENADQFIVGLGALVHDIADHKFHDGDHKIGPAKARDWLHSVGCTPEETEKVVDIVKEISFKGAGVATPMSSLEGQCVQDADRLDAIGAIGIARVFAYGGSTGQPIHEPGQKVVMHESFEDYKSARTTSINHFYEKLLLLKNLMNTKTGRTIGESRHQFMLEYLDRFYAEVEGSK